MIEVRPLCMVVCTWQHPRRMLATAMLMLGAFLFFVRPAGATDFSGTTYTVKDPVLSGGGGYATSSNFQLWSAVAQPAIGRSTTSGGTLELRAGFLYFPTPTPTPTSAPTPTPTPAPGGGPSNTPEETKRSVQEFFARHAALPPLPGLPLPPELIPDCPVPRRSDFNCDGEVGLADFSIYLSVPTRVTPYTLSLVLSDWTTSFPSFVSRESILALTVPGRDVSEGTEGKLTRGLAVAKEEFKGEVLGGASRNVEVNRGTVWGLFRSLLRGIEVFIARILVFIQGLW